MVKALLSLFGSIRFIGPQKQPKRWDLPAHKPRTLFSREFILLFLMAMCSNSFIAVYYCFEQWMQGLAIPPAWRGILLSSLFAMILLFRPLASILILKHGKLWSMIISLIFVAGVMMVYPLVTPANAIPLILGLRLIQGIALAVYGACTVTVLVDCIPPGQSARGFAIFSLTMLLPYSIVPAIAEEILPLVGGEARLFATLAWLAAPSFLMIFLMSKRLRQPELSPVSGANLSRQAFIHAITHSGLGFVYMACLCFSMMTGLAIFFMKGLCAVTGDHPAQFFTTYSVTIILVRLFGGHLMDTLPRHLVSVLCAAILALCMLGFAWTAQWLFIPLSCVYGLALGLLYPLMAAAVYDRSTPETRSVNSNLMMATFDASGMLAPLLGGVVIAEGLGYRGVFSAAAITVAICGICMCVDGALMAIRKRKKALEAG